MLGVLFLVDKAAPLGLIDKPDSRKRHDGDIPAVGGLAIYLSVVAGVLIAGFDISVYTPLMVAGLLVVTGLLDDRFGLSARLRLPIQGLAAVFMMHFGGIGIETIGGVWGVQPIVFTGLTVGGFTVMCTVGVINSINMLDGIDGLSGTIISITFIPLVFLSWGAGETGLVVLLISFLSSILVFLYFNARVFRVTAKVFLGDTGSMLLGFILVWTLITLTQGPNAVLSPTAAGWIFGLPLVDTVSVMVGRLLKKRSPFDADRTHLHYKLLDAGLSVNRTVVILMSIHLLFVIVGLLANAVSVYEPLLFWSFIFVVVLHYFLTGLAISSYFEKGKRVGVEL